MLMVVVLGIDGWKVESEEAPLRVSLDIGDVENQSVFLSSHNDLLAPHGQPR